MPLVLPGAWVESDRGSAVTLRHADDETFAGIYHPVPTNQAATLEGKITKQADGTQLISATWRHTHGEKLSGTC